MVHSISSPFFLMQDGICVQQLCPTNAFTQWYGSRATWWVYTDTALRFCLGCILSVAGSSWCRTLCTLTSSAKTSFTAKDSLLLLNHLRIQEQFIPFHIKLIKKSCIKIPARCLNLFFFFQIQRCKSESYQKQWQQITFLCGQDWYYFFFFFAFSTVSL